MRVDCVVMAGGRGSRLGGVEKPLIKVCGRPMILGVLEAASKVCRRLVLVYSSHTESLAALCRRAGLRLKIECLKGSGESYVEDLALAMGALEPPVLVLPADMPLLTWEYLDDFLSKALPAPAPVVNLVTKRGPTGISLFKKPGGSWWDLEYPVAPALLDVDTPEDLAEAEACCK